MDSEAKDRQEKCINLFSVKSTDKQTGTFLYINFKASNSIEEPPHIDEDALRQEISNPTPRIEQFRVPIELSQIYWRQTGQGGEKSDYVIDVYLGSKFAYRQVIKSPIIRDYVINITMLSIEEKYNQENTAKVAHQRIGHKLQLDLASYEILESKQVIRRSREPVNNKIILVDRPSAAGAGQEQIPSGSGETSKNDDAESSYDLYLRPTSMLLTCVLQIDTCPDSISFNDDRICIESKEKTLLDVFLPLRIDLETPAKFKFDDRLGLFRLVFKLLDS